MIISYIKCHKDSHYPHLLNNYLFNYLNFSGLTVVARKNSFCFFFTLYGLGCHGTQVVRSLCLDFQLNWGIRFVKIPNSWTSFLHFCANHITFSSSPFLHEPPPRRTQHCLIPLLLALPSMTSWLKLKPHILYCANHNFCSPPFLLCERTPQTLTTRTTTMPVSASSAYCWRCLRRRVVAPLTTRTTTMPPCLFTCCGIFCNLNPFFVYLFCCIFVSSVLRRLLVCTYS